MKEDKVKRGLHLVSDPPGGVPLRARFVAGKAMSRIQGAGEPSCAPNSMVFFVVYQCCVPVLCISVQVVYQCCVVGIGLSACNQGVECMG